MEIQSKVNDRFSQRSTEQRQLILDIIQQANRHLDADEIYQQACQKQPSISLSTVYRSLQLFKSLGLVEEHRLGEDHGHYEAARQEPHYHFTCLRCGKVIEFDTPLVAQVEQTLRKREGVRVTGAHLHVSGYCAQCRGIAD